MLLCYTVFAVFALLHEAHTECTIAINEVNTNWMVDKTSTNNNFIELRMIGCRPSDKPPMKQFSILTIAVIEESSVCKTQIEFVASLYHQTFTGKYFIIGSDQLHSDRVKVDLKFSQPAVSSRQKFVQTGQQLSLDSHFSSTKKLKTNFFGKHEKKAVAVVLLKASSSQSLPKFTLSNSGIILLASGDSNWDKIKSHLHDALIFTNTAVSLPAACKEKLQQLTELIFQNNNADTVILENDVDETIDKSINRCPTSSNFVKRFNFEEFKSGLPTPRADNDCESAQFVGRLNVAMISDTTTTANQEDFITDSYQPQEAQTGRYVHDINDD